MADPIEMERRSETIMKAYNGVPLEFRLWYQGKDYGAAEGERCPWRLALWWNGEDSDIANDIVHKDGRWYGADPSPRVPSFGTLKEAVLWSMEMLLEYARIGEIDK